MKGFHFFCFNLSNIFENFDQKMQKKKKKKKKKKKCQKSDLGNFLRFKNMFQSACTLSHEVTFHVLSPYCFKSNAIRKAPSRPIFALQMIFTTP